MAGSTEFFSHSATFHRGGGFDNEDTAAASAPDADDVKAAPDDAIAADLSADLTPSAAFEAMLFAAVASIRNMSLSSLPFPVQLLPRHACPQKLQKVDLEVRGEPPIPNCDYHTNAHSYKNDKFVSSFSSSISIFLINFWAQPARYNSARTITAEE